MKTVNPLNSSTQNSGKSTLATKNLDLQEPSRCQGPVGRNKHAQFRHRGSGFAVGLPKLRKLVPAYIFLDGWGGQHAAGHWIARRGRC